MSKPLMSGFLTLFLSELINLNKMKITEVCSFHMKKENIHRNLLN